MTGPEEVRLRDVLPPMPEGDPKETGAKLAREGKTEKEAAGIGWYRKAELHALRTGAFEVLLPAYLKEHKLSAKEALDVLELLGSGPLYDLQVLESKDPSGYEEVQKAYSRIRLARLVALALWVEKTGTVDPEKSVTVDAPADLVEAVRDEARVVSEQGQGAAFVWLVNGPDCVQEMAASGQELVAPYELSKKERAARAKRILKKRPDPLAYLKAKGWGGGFLAGNPSKPARQILTEIVGREGGTDNSSATPSAGRVVIVEAFLGLHEMGPRLARRRLRKYRAYDDEMQIALDLMAEEPENQAQLAAFSVTEKRVILGAFASFSRNADDGSKWKERIHVDLRRFAEDCALDLSSGKNRNDLLAALASVGKKSVRSPVPVLSKKSNDPWRVVLYEGPILKAYPVVSMSTPRDIAAIRFWEETGEWKGKAPTEIILELKDIYRYVRGGLVLDHTYLRQVDAAAKRLRGRLVDLDLHLLFGLCRLGPRQLTHKGPNGHPATYINRDQFLRDCEGVERVAKEKKAGRYSTRIEAAYLKSVEVLVEAGIVFPDWKAGHEGRNGLRDVFELQPWVIKQLKERVDRGQKRLRTKKGGK